MDFVKLCGSKDWKVLEQPRPDDKELGLALHITAITKNIDLLKAIIERFDCRELAIEEAHIYGNGWYTLLEQLIECDLYDPFFASHVVAKMPGDNIRQFLFCVVLADKYEGMLNWDKLADEALGSGNQNIFVRCNCMTKKTIARKLLRELRYN